MQFNNKEYTSMYYNSNTSPIAYTYNSSPLTCNSNDSLSTPYTYNSLSTSFNSNESLSMSSSFSSYPYNNKCNYNYENDLSSPTANFYYKPIATTYGYANSTMSSYNNSSPNSYIPSNYYYTSSSNSTSSSNLNSHYQRSILNDALDESSPAISIIEPQISTGKKIKSNKGHVSRKHMLPDEAVDILNDWFDEHLSHPYPQMEEKERLAKRGNITVKQVNAWFSNRRNRSQNTKPKRIQRDMEKKMSGLLRELSSTSHIETSKDQLLEKLRQTLSNQCDKNY